MRVELKDLRPGQTARVAGYRPGLPGYRQKLLAMGLTPGTLLRLVRVAPLGDPLEIEVRGYLLSLRRAEADALTIEGADA